MINEFFEIESGFEKGLKFRLLVTYCDNRLII